MVRTILSICFLAGIMVTTVSAEPAVTVRETAVRAEPAHQADQLAVLPAGASVDILDRQGGWYEIDFAADEPGWLPLLSVRKEKGTAPERRETSGLRGLLSTFRTGSSGVTVATGVRGLDAVDLKNSRPNMEELARIDQFVSTTAAAKQYADRAGLVSRDVDWLEVPGKGR